MLDETFCFRTRTLTWREVKSFSINYHKTLVRFGHDLLPSTDANRVKFGGLLARCKSQVNGVAEQQQPGFCTWVRGL
jgi:hypothetical protein